MFRNFGADSLEMECFCILRDVNFRLQVHSDINHAIHARFHEEGISIPFPQRGLWFRNPEVLPGATPPAGTADDAPREDTPPQNDAEPKAEEGRPA
jgi:small-conductance mechanosensitive channel